MPLSEAIPTDPHVVLDPAIRWYPGDGLIGDVGREKRGMATLAQKK